MPLHFKSNTKKKKKLILHIVQDAFSVQAIISLKTQNYHLQFGLKMSKKCAYMLHAYCLIFVKQAFKISNIKFKRDKWWIQMKKILTIFARSNKNINSFFADVCIFHKNISSSSHHSWNEMKLTIIPVYNTTINRHFS